MRVKEKSDERELEDEEVYSLLVENAMDALVVCDQEANFLYVSPSMEKLSGYKSEELIGHNASEFYHPEDIAASKERLKLLLEGRLFSSTEFRFKKKNNEYAWCEMATKAVKTTQGNSRIIVVAKDVTERKNLQEELRKHSENLQQLVADRSIEINETTEYLEQLVRSLPLALIAWDKQLKANTCNPEATQMYGFSETEFGGIAFASLFPPGQSNKILSPLARGEATTFTAENLTKDNKKIICRWINTPLKDAAGMFGGVLSIIEDVTEKKNMEERLKDITYSLSGIKAGESYLVSSLQHSLKIAFDMSSHGVECLFIVRENPNRLVRDFNFKPQEIFVLSKKGINQFKAVDDIQQIAIMITNFLKNGGGFVLLGGLEYLISRHGFNAVFLMLQEKRFEFLESKATLLVPVNLDTLYTREKGLLNSELKMIN